MSYLTQAMLYAYDSSSELLKITTDHPDYHDPGFKNSKGRTVALILAWDGLGTIIPRIW